MDWVQIIAEYCGNLVCQICFERNFNVAFGCGHLACEECLNRILMNEEEGYEIPRCHVCRSYI